MLELIRGTRERGHTASLIARPESEIIQRARQIEGLEVHPFRFRSRLSPLNVPRLRRLLADLGADLLHLHDGHAVAIGVPAAHAIPDVGLVVHRRVSSPMRRNPSSRARYRSGRVDAFIAVSESARASLLDIDVRVERTHLVPSGVDPKLLVPRPSGSHARRVLGLPEGCWIGTVGALDPKKDIATFVRMAVLLARRDAQIRFLVVGDGRQRSELEALARDSGFGDRITFTGNVVDAHRYIAAMDVFVFPSLREGSPGVVKEAMALGVPVVAANAPGTVEVIQGDTGICVPPGSEAAFAAAVDSLLADPAAARARSQRAREHVAQKFSMENTVDGTLDVYRAVLQARRRSSLAGEEQDAMPTSSAEILQPAPARSEPARRSTSGERGRGWNAISK